MREHPGGRRHALKQRTRDHIFDARRRQSGLGLTVRVVSAFMLMVALVACGQASSPQQRPSDPLPQKGDKAPHFTLESSTGDQVALSDFRKKDVLLYFSMGPG
jgi:cytochrome oxidase Cu insertion factor (SCO1/SenC/PrrC family)